MKTHRSAPYASKPKGKGSWDGGKDWGGGKASGKSSGKPTSGPDAPWNPQSGVMPDVVASHHLALSFLIPRSAVGKVLGKGGQAIKEIKRRTGVDTTIDTDSHGGEEVTVTCIGQVAQLMEAHAAVVESSTDSGMSNGKGW